MKIIINATQQEAHITGTDRLARNILEHLQTLDTTNHYIILCTRGFDYIPSVITAANFTVVRQGVFRGYRKLLVAPLRLARSLRFKYLDRPDVFYSFHNMYTPRVPFAPVVVSALDLIPLIFPQQYHRNFAAEQSYTALLKRACRVAQHFIAISAHTKQDLEERLAVPAERITVMHLAAETKFRHDFTAANKQRVKQKYSLPDTYILTIGANEPRKNVAGAIEAFRQLPSALQRSHSLVILGKTWRDQRLEAIADLPVSFTGFVDDDDLPILYNAAACFVFLSTYEGFGLPVLEAMACGVPVVSANTSSIPEAAGAAALLVDPLDSAAAANAIASILGSPKLTHELTRKGLAQAARFSWKTAAQILLDVLTKVGTN